MRKKGLAKYEVKAHRTKDVYFVATTEPCFPTKAAYGKARRELGVTLPNYEAKMPTKSGDLKTCIREAADGCNPTDADRKSVSHGNANEGQAIDDAGAREVEESLGGDGYRGIIK